MLFSNFATEPTQLCSCLEVSTEVLITPEGLNQRFNATAVQFLQQVLTELLNQKLSSTKLLYSPYTSIFKRIRILDSTSFQLPDPFSFVYPGAGRCSHTAGVKIQLEYDLLSGQFLHIHTGPGKQNVIKTYFINIPTFLEVVFCIILRKITEYFFPNNGIQHRESLYCGVYKFSNKFWYMKL